MQEGQLQSKRWKLIQVPRPRSDTNAAYYRFVLEQVAAYPRTQLWRVILDGRTKRSRSKFARPDLLTLHGTDIRENYWQKLHQAAVEVDIDGAG